MNIAIVANGTLDKQLLPGIKKAAYIIGVDRGAYWLLQHGVTPHIALGDFDSTSAKELATIQKSVQTFQEAPHPKYKTDLELAADHATSLHPAHVAIYGATGTRLDQTLAAIHLLEQFLAASTPAAIHDVHNTLQMTDRALTIKKSSDFSYFSLISHTEQAIVSIRGARYPLDHHMLQRETSLGVSNEISAHEAVIDVYSGKVLVIQSRD